MSSFNIADILNAINVSISLIMNICITFLQYLGGPKLLTPFNLHSRRCSIKKKTIMLKSFRQNNQQISVRGLILTGPIY